MTSLRESPIRRQKSSRPTWLTALLIVVALLVVVGIGYGILSLVRGSSDSSASDSPAAVPTPCVTTMVAAGDALPQPVKVKVNVYNATATSGLASKTATAVEKRGFTIVDVANDPTGKPITGVAQIRYGPKGESGARLLQLYLPGAEMVQLDRKGRQVDLAVGDAYTELVPQDEVDAQLAITSPVVSGPGCASPMSEPSPS
jgi:hypothetical protein